MAGLIKDPKVTQQQESKDRVDLMSVADFLFGVKSIERIAKGQGSWSDLLNVGVTAATFLIPPAKLLKLKPSALDKVFKSAKKVIDSNDVSEAAKRAAQRTLDSVDNVRGKPVRTTNRTRYEEIDDINLSPDELEAKKIAERFKNREPEYQALQKQTDIEIEKTLTKNKKFKGSKEEKTANEIEQLNKQTLAKKNEWDKTPTQTPKRSAIGSELDQVLYDRETLQGLLTGEVNKEATGKITAILRRWANETDDEVLKRQYFKDIKDIKDNKLSSNLVNRIRNDIDKLDNKAAKLQSYIDDPTLPAAIRQSEATIPFRKVNKKTGTETMDYAKPRSYQAKESVRKSGKAPDSPKRSTISELKQDEESLMNLLEKETDPIKRGQLRKELETTRKELFNAEVGRGRQYISDTAELQKELDALRKQYMQAKNNRTKELIKKRGQEVAARLKKLEGK